MTNHETAFATLVIVAAGRGERFGARAKVLELAGGKPILEWSLIAADHAQSVRDIVIVTGEHTELGITDLVMSGRRAKPVTLVSGGEQRQDSVAAGVAEVSSASTVVLVHDAARPLVTSTILDQCAMEARLHGAAIVAVPVSDTLKRVVGSEIEETVPRDGLWGAQTPQGFRRDVIVSAIARTRHLKMQFTDEASLLEYLGERVRIVPGERTNIKVTHREDLDMVNALLEMQRDTRESV